MIHSGRIPRAIVLTLALTLMLDVTISASALAVPKPELKLHSAAQRHARSQSLPNARRTAHHAGSPSAWGGLPARFDPNLARAWNSFHASAARVSPPGAAPTVAVGGDPVGDVVDPTTHTVYVTNNADNSVSVISATSCSAARLSGCDQIAPTVAVGGGPLGLAVDEPTRTLYVTNTADNTVSMINLAIDNATNTIYVPNGNDATVSVIDGATCNATDTSGCAHTSTVTTGPGAGAVALNQRTHTAYVANYNNGTVSLIDTATCNATQTSGCGQTPPTVTVGVSPDALVVDQASNTIYVAVGPAGGGFSSASLGSVAMINGASCNATVTSGCGQPPRTTPIGSSPIWIAENAATHTVYAVNEEDMSVSVIDAASCNATETAGCRQTPPALAIGGKTSVVVGFPDFGAGAVAIDPTTDTLYATSQDENNVSVLNGATCDATNISGCTRFAPTTTVGNGPQGIAANPATNTVYVGNQNLDTVSVIDAAACNATNGGGCDRTWPTVSVGSFPQAIAVDKRTDTIYVANLNENTVSVINGATCNAATSAGCGLPPATVTVGSSPAALAVDQRTDTIYVANGNDNTVSVINGATCNGTDASGCSHTPPTIDVGNGPADVAVDPVTDTVYVTNGNDGTLSVINGATCNGTDTTGCGKTPATDTVGPSPNQLAVDSATDTIYVANLGDQTLALINGATCNGRVSTDCAQTPPTVPVEGLPFGVAVDQRADTVYVTSIVDSDVASINSRTCNATNTHHCAAVPVPVRMGGWPSSIALDPAVDTAYVPDNVDGTVSFFHLRPR
jgi:DNA-binding beta-propeller fold protein YncE